MERYNVGLLVEGVLNGHKGSLGKSITLVESQNERHHPLGQELIEKLLPYSGKSRRVGISGVPGVGKSTFIEGFGSWYLKKERKLAVLAVDPSSEKTKGSILGDKTRMVELSRHPNAFIRPSATGGALGGVTRKSRETIIILEAAGYSDIFVETVGVGQSEAQVAKMVDLFLVLMLPTAGDELQGIKRGILESAHAIIINKCDIDEVQTRRAEREYLNALHYFRADEKGWEPRVLSCSGLKQIGFDSIESMLDQFFNTEDKSFIDQQRKEQQKEWYKESLERLALEHFFNRSDVQERYQKALSDLEAHRSTPAKSLHDIASLLDG
ncbi:MAG: methylmalonyl Co-A mutase-associated GTPase MeaB [Pseudobacteriovorax sp.]|nr:methylmalonyl Co-A mutase-associated GTPase MeaB [Pseudobacteriovorax sp.]